METRDSIAARSFVAAVVLVAVGSSPSEAGGGHAQEGAQAQALQALRQEYGATSQEFRQAKTDEERKAAVEHLHPYPARFVAIAEQRPEDASALEALVEAVRAMNSADSLTMTSWEMSTSSFPSGGKDDAAARATALLSRHHLKSEKLGAVCERMSYGVRREMETFLRSAVAMSPHREVQAIAGLALARFLGTRVQKLDQLVERPELGERFESLLGKEDFDAVRRHGRERMAAEIEALLERAAAQYGDVKIPYSGTAAEVATAQLFELRRLAVGKEAPDIEGQDQDGQRFKLSDYRGKVVLLDFWSEY